MKVTINGMVIEGTPQEITFFLEMNQLYPDSRPSFRPVLDKHIPAADYLHYQAIKKVTSVRK
ncbi:hypothetical protein [Brevibacillus migulae]|uniref:hypothetical protein n=1 Tax=Brevibacillus migulae TaxID=1644114 RepID=UPI00106F0088|nr:hypothetical protein [Brevibacillus migulae]